MMKNFGSVSLSWEAGPSQTQEREKLSPVHMTLRKTKSYQSAPDVKRNVFPYICSLWPWPSVYSLDDCINVPFHSQALQLERTWVVHHAHMVV